MSQPDPPPWAAWPGLPRDDRAAPVFAEPWQAQAFALVLELHARGAFTWKEWTHALATELAAQTPDDGSRYYEHWLNALERLVSTLGLVDSAALAARASAWAEAYRRTPHGEPVIPPDASIVSARKLSP